MAKLIIDQFRLLDKKLNLSGILNIYRYASFIVISVFFLFFDKTGLPAGKAFIVCSIGLSALLLSYLYRHCLNNTKVVWLLLLLETILNAFILIPSGGLESPYIWYSLNTIIIAMVTLKRRIYCWLNLIVYLFSSTWVLTFLLDDRGNFPDIIREESNIILSLLLITGAIQLLFRNSRETGEKNKALEEVNSRVLSANKKIKESMDYIMELYQAVHLLTTQKDRDNLVNIILEYTGKITKSELIFFIVNNDGKQVILPFRPDIENIDKMKEILSEISMNIGCMTAPESFETQAGSMILAPMKCKGEVYGVIGVKMPPFSRDDAGIDISDQLMFLSELGTIALEKFDLERVNRDLLINEEQNRIANEIHDGVLQKLFSISCGVYGLMKKSAAMERKKMQSELSMLQSSINSAMSDLRSTIYGYSWKKKGSNSFILDVGTYIDVIRRYHGVDINFKLSGNCELLSTDHKKAFYRIITEGIGNALRHGNAGYISILLDIGIKDILFQIKDDGTGFDTNILEETGKMGMGLRNMQFLTHSLFGSIRMKSEPGRGTTIDITVPIELKEEAPQAL